MIINNKSFFYKRYLEHNKDRLPIQLIGAPTYCVAVITKLHVKSNTVVKTLCSLKTALSVCIS